VTMCKPADHRGRNNIGLDVVARGLAGKPIICFLHREWHRLNSVADMVCSADRITLGRDCLHIAATFRRLISPRAQPVARHEPSCRNSRSRRSGFRL
jgi:hypothetical protein